MAESGGARIPWARWLELAQEAGVHPGDLPAVVENLVMSDQPFLDRDPSDPERYTLAEGHGGELRVIVQGGEMSARGRRRQALSAKKSKNKK